MIHFQSLISFQSYRIQVYYKCKCKIVCTRFESATVLQTKRIKCLGKNLGFFKYASEFHDIDYIRNNFWLLKSNFPWYRKHKLEFLPYFSRKWSLVYCYKKYFNPFVEMKFKEAVWNIILTKTILYLLAILVI